MGLEYDWIKIRKSPFFLVTQRSMAIMIMMSSSWKSLQTRPLPFKWFPNTFRPQGSRQIFKYTFDTYFTFQCPQNFNDSIVPEQGQPQFINLQSDGSKVPAINRLQKHVTLCPEASNAISTLNKIRHMFDIYFDGYTGSRRNSIEYYEVTFYIQRKKSSF